MAVLASHPVQYFTPIYQRLAATPGIDLEVFFCREFGTRPSFDKQFDRTIVWDTDLLSGFRHRFLWNVSPIRDTFNPLHAINPGAFTRVLRGFDALWVNGYLYPSNWLAAAAAALRGTRLLLRSELRVDGDRSRWYDRPRRAVLRRWILHADALLYIGQANRDAYVSYGAREENLFFCPYAGDTRRIRGARFADDATRIDALARWGLPSDRVIVLFAGKLTPRKHPENMLAIATDPVLENKVHVVIAGSGPLDATLKERLRSRGITNVTMTGFVNQSQLPELYALSDIFVMPSIGEPWGVVLHEAMTAECAVVVSSEVGAARDLVADGDTGYTFPPTDESRMIEQVRMLVSDPMRRHRMAAAGRDRAAVFSHDHAVAGVLDALRALRLFRFLRVGEPTNPEADVVASSS
ncbi:MAG TPA: glycosyltransferase family 4 protein [Vicinamibacterales bacterium]|nr:glycosyltransferase family 4 protein [Vicinamibacterales bacterium]